MLHGFSILYVTQHPSTGAAKNAGCGPEGDQKLATILQPAYPGGVFLNAMTSFALGFINKMIL